MINDLVIGTYTHRSSYYPRLLASLSPVMSAGVPTLVIRRDQSILENIRELRLAFLASRKRYWLFLDDDVEFISTEAVIGPLGSLIRSRWAGAGIYSTAGDRRVTPYNPSDLQERQAKWLVGYYMLFDSHKMGDIEIPQTPNPNYGIDLAWCADIRRRGHSLGVSPHYVYHEHTPDPEHEEDWKRLDEYLVQRHGASYRTAMLGPLGVDLK